MSGLSLKHIYKVYPNGTKAVNDFNMEINDKEFIVFVGPSGCGKSTLLRMIAGLEEITTGELRIDEKVVNNMEPKDRDIAMVFQNYALYPHMTIYDNIAFGLEMRRVPINVNGNSKTKMTKLSKSEIDAKVTDAAKILGITEYLKKKPKEMSGGQRQRVALGRAIVREPKVMLLDEPLSNLDAKLRTQMRSEIVKLHNKLQTTFIYVTHDQVEAMTMGTRIVVMKLGFIQQIDTPKNLYCYPANKFVAGFIGTPQMNFITGTLIKEKNQIRINFCDTDSSIVVPSEKLQKIMPKYLDGKTKVCIGIRAENLFIEQNDKTNNTATVMAKVSHTEELGTETLIYADLNCQSDASTQNDTRIIVKAGGFKSVQRDEIINVNIDTSALHFFDIETEESILPRIPQFNFLETTVTNQSITIAGNKIKLPKSIICNDGKYECLLPVSAVKLNGKFDAELCEQEEIDGKYLLTVKCKNKTLFAQSDNKINDSIVKIDFDLKQMILRSDDIDIVAPIPLINRLDGIFELERKKIGKEKISNYYITICGKRFKSTDDVTKKMCSAFPGRKVFNTLFTYEWSPYDIIFTDDPHGIKVKFEEFLDYGEEHFIKCSIAENILYVYTDNQTCPENITNLRIIPKAESVSVVEKEMNIRIV